MATFEVSRVIPAPAAETCAWMLRAPLTTVFSRGFGPLPRIVATEQDGEWGQVGQVRVVRTADRSSMREELLAVDDGASFDYLITEFRGPLQHLAARVHGRWTFDPVPTGTRATWRWEVEPASRPAAVLMPALAVLWRGYGRRALLAIESGVSRG